MLNHRKGQSTLEYIAVFTAVVAAIVILAYSKLQPAVSSVLDASAAKISSAAQDFKGDAVVTIGTTGTSQ